MTSRALVVTTVHASDDTRIRERLIRTLADHFSITYASRGPGPADDSGIHWEELKGGRVARWWRALAILLRTRWDVAVVHDPELVPAAMIARLARRKPVVFDVHEDLPAQVASKVWIPRMLRPTGRLFSKLLFRLAESALTLTLAEVNYAWRFRGEHPVFPNYPRYDNWPGPNPKGEGSAVYLGDVQVVRGVFEAVESCRMADVPLTIVGPVATDLAGRLAAEEAVTLTGRLPNPEALQLVGSASVGLSLLRPEPNYLASLPTKVIEYLAMGLPVVATDLPGTRQVVGDMEAVWLVRSGDIPGTAEAIREAVSDESRQLAQSRIEQVRDRYRWPEEAVTDFYLSLVVNRGDSPVPS